MLAISRRQTLADPGRSVAVLAGLADPGRSVARLRSCASSAIHETALLKGSLF
jgi:hypothetical protein